MFNGRPGLPAGNGWMRASEERAAPGELLARRREAVLGQAREAGLLGEDKDARISGRVRRALIEAAKRRTGLSSDTELVEYALARVALEDEFGARLVRRKGAVPPDVDLGL